MFEHVLIPIHLCCNDPRNGNFSEQLAGFEIGDNMKFECRYGDWEPRLRYVVDPNPGRALIRAIALAGKHFPVTDYHPWYGNWCWDAFKMEGRYVLELLNWPRLRKWFDISEAEQRLFNWWQVGEKWTDDDLRLISKVFK
jgi:hypothetical protein